MGFPETLVTCDLARVLSEAIKRRVSRAQPSLSSLVTKPRFALPLLNGYIPHYTSILKFLLTLVKVYNEGEGIFLLERATTTLYGEKNLPYN